MQTKQLKLEQLNAQIKERTEYLRSIELQIEEVSANGNNALLDMNREIDAAEKELARVLRRSLELDQQNRERESLA